MKMRIRTRFRSRGSKEGRTKEGIKRRLKRKERLIRRSEYKTLTATKKIHYLKRRLLKFYIMLCRGRMKRVRR